MCCRHRLLVCVCAVQGNISDCDDKFAVVFGCLQVNGIIGREITEFIPSVTICDNNTTVSRVCQLNLLSLLNRCAVSTVSCCTKYINISTSKYNLLRLLFQQSADRGSSVPT